MTSENFGEMGGNLSREQQIDTRLKTALGQGLGENLPFAVDPKALREIFDNLPQSDLGKLDEPITENELTASIERLGYQLIEEDGEEPFYRKD